MWFSFTRELLIYTLFLAKYWDSISKAKVRAVEEEEFFSFSARLFIGGTFLSDFLFAFVKLGLTTFLGSFTLI